MSPEAVWQDVECGSYRADLDMWRKLASQQQHDGRCRMLDLGCGTGRVSLPLAADGCQVTALDSEPALVDELRRRAASRGVVLDALVADACSFDLRHRFDLILAPMQLVQLMETRARKSLLSSVARHLDAGGLAALALLDFDDEWVAEPAEAPLPDVLERDGWVFSSQPLAVRGRARSIELERLRKAVSPSGELRESPYRVRLAVVSADALEREASDAGLLTHRRLQIPPTPDHVGSTVVVLGADG